MKNWYKNAIIYSLDIEAYRDADNDGTGDFEGLRRSLPYLSSLGVNCLWLLPFFSTPNKDNGYDVADYFSIDKRLGNFGTFTEFIDVARENNIRLIIDLVVNHTSVEHSWFQEALKGPENPYFDYYIWVDEKPEDHTPTEIFGEQQDGNWEYVEELGKYYYHTFYNFQPDLNLANPKVREEIRRVMHFWINLGINGFRMDAVTHMIRKKHEGQNFDKPPLKILEEFRGFINDIAPSVVLLAEADVKPQQYEDFFKGKAAMHMLLNFYANNYLFYSLAVEEAKPLIDAFKELPQENGSEHYGNFIRNHDELDLERLSEDERKLVFEKFAPEDDMRIFGRGIRRRFHPMMKGDTSLMKLGYSILFSLPGTPVLRYGQEIGMGDNLSLTGRDSVRTVMQWSNERNGGFSNAPEEKLARPVISEGPYGYKEINVNDQLRDYHSLLNWMTHAIQTRRRCPEFGSGSYEFLDSGDNQVMIHIASKENDTSLAVHNFSNEKKKIRLPISDELASELINIFGDEPYDALGCREKEIEINPKGYRWFRKGF